MKYDNDELKKEEKYSCLIDELNFLDNPTCEILFPDHIGWDLDLELKDFPYIVSPLLGDSTYRSVYGGEGFLPENTFVFYNSFVMGNSTFNPAIQIDMSKKFLRGGPRKHLFFRPS